MFRNDIKARLDQIKKRIQLAVDKSGRTEKDVTLLGACKQVGYQRIVEAVNLGLDHLGENKSYCQYVMDTS